MTHSGDVSTAKLIGQLWERCELKDFEDEVMASLRRGARTVVLDMSRLSFINSQGLGLLVRLYIQMSKADNRLILYNPRSSVQETIQISGFDQFMKIVYTEEELGKLVSNS